VGLEASVRGRLTVLEALHVLACFSMPRFFTVDMMHETTLVRPIARAGKPSEVQDALVSFEGLRCS
jgi:hypothetical protein